MEETAEPTVVFPDGSTAGELSGVVKLRVLFPGGTYELPVSGESAQRLKNSARRSTSEAQELGLALLVVHVQAQLQALERVQEPLDAAWNLMCQGSFLADAVEHFSEIIECIRRASEALREDRQRYAAQSLP